MGDLKGVPLPIDRIRTDGGTQPREQINPDVVDAYAEILAQNEDHAFPPIVVFLDGPLKAPHYWLADGFHRLDAHKKAGRKSIRADIHNGTQRDAVLYSVGANAEHGLQRSNADKRRAVLTLLQDEEWGQWSDREIARRCRVDHKTVANVRASLRNSSVRAAPDQTAPTAPVTGEIPSETPPSIKAAAPPPVDSGQRTYVTRHGTTATMDTANIGRRPPQAPPPVPQAPAGTETEPQTVTLQVFSPLPALEESATLAGLKALWQEASAEEREAFRRYQAEHPS